MKICCYDHTLICIYMMLLWSSFYYIKSMGCKTHISTFCFVHEALLSGMENCHARYLGSKVWDLGEPSLNSCFFSWTCVRSNLFCKYSVCVNRWHLILSAVDTLLRAPDKYNGEKDKIGLPSSLIWNCFSSWTSKKKSVLRLGEVTQRSPAWHRLLYKFSSYLYQHFFTQIFWGLCNISSSF